MSWNPFDKKVQYLYSFFRKISLIVAAMKLPLIPHLKELLVKITRMGCCRNCCNICCMGCCNFWIYNTKSRSNFFTLIFMLGLYTVGGALVFTYIEGSNEALRSKQEYSKSKNESFSSLVSNGEWT